MAEDDLTITAVRCGNGHILPQTGPGGPCASCGSVERRVDASMEAGVGFEGHHMAHGTSGAKVRPGRRLWESWTGDDFHRDTGTWRKLRRLIDRRQKPERYTERIEDASGTATRDVDEPLQQHQERGSARKT